MGASIPPVPHYFASNFSAQALDQANYNQQSELQQAWAEGLYGSGLRQAATQATVSRKCSYCGGILRLDGKGHCKGCGSTG